VLVWCTYLFVDCFCSLNSGCYTGFGGHTGLSSFAVLCMGMLCNCWKIYSCFFGVNWGWSLPRILLFVNLVILKMWPVRYGVLTFRSHPVCSSVQYVAEEQLLIWTAELANGEAATDSVWSLRYTWVRMIERVVDCVDACSWQNIGWPAIAFHCSWI